MTVSKRTAMIWWVGGLIAFAIVIALSAPLITDTVPGGISDHQKAPNAAAVDGIQNAWRADGLAGLATISMIGDLIFVGIYGIGCVLAGMHYRAHGAGVLRLLGWIAMGSGIVFLVSDYGETVCQLIQMVRFAGDNDLAAIASGLRPIKVAAWIVSFLAVVGALLAERSCSGKAPG